MLYMFLIFLSMFLSLRSVAGCPDVDAADPICLAFLPLFPANDILLSWETAPMMFACVCETSIPGFVISIAHLLEILQTRSVTWGSHARYSTCKYDKIQPTWLLLLTPGARRLAAQPWLKDVAWHNFMQKRTKCKAITCNDFIQHFRYTMEMRLIRLAKSN